jgi:hypothetical protein
MCSLDRLKDIRAFEFFLFGGIPEAPESMFERDSHNHVDVRRTRRGLADESESFVGEAGEVNAIIEIDPATGALKIQKIDGGSNPKR